LLTATTLGLVAGSTLIAEPGRRLFGGVLVTLAVAAAIAFVAVERGATEPLIAPAAWRSARLRWGTVGSFSNTATTSGSFTLAMLYLQDELGLTPLRAAALLIAFSIMVVAGAAAAPRLIARTGWGPALGCGLITIGLGNSLLAAWPGQLAVTVAAAVAGLGIGVGSVAATDMGTDVPSALKATAAGMLNTAAQLGTALGTSLVLLLATALESRTAWALVAALAVTVGVAAGRFGPRAAVEP
jgi:MFS family permease